GFCALTSLRGAHLTEPLPFKAGSFDAAMSLDVVLHLRDRSKLFHEVARLLRPGGRFLFTDAGVITGSVSNEEVHKRSVHGYTEFVTAGWNEGLLESAGVGGVGVGGRSIEGVWGASGGLGGAVGGGGTDG